jgi:hypothetical protein
MPSPESERIRQIPKVPGFIRVYHPGYAWPLLLCVLPAYDQTKDDARFGVAHRLALDACYVIADNREGYITGANGVSIDLEASTLLYPGQDYYYYVENPASNAALQYLIVNEFEDWTPRPTLLDHWRPESLGLEDELDASDAVHASQMSGTVRARDANTCVITRFKSVFDFIWSSYKSLLIFLSDEWKGSGECAHSPARSGSVVRIP